MLDYEPLPTGQWIRLLRLHPALTDGDASSIVCTLLIVPLENASYEAISYAWGDPKQTRQINCNGYMIDVTVSLYGALSRLQPCPDAEPRVLWADAICIDQSNLAERSAQVSMMGLIYERASGVQIWLGQDIQDDAQPAFDLCREINEYYGSSAPPGDRGIWYGWPPPPDPNEPFLDPARWKHLGALSECPWFSRLWVLQEVGVARTVDVNWGSKASIKLSELVEASLSITVHTNFAPLIDSYGICLTYILNAWTQIWCTYNIKDSWQNERPLIRLIANSPKTKERRSIFDVLYVGTHYEASDPHDYIYAQLGHPAARKDDGKGFVDVDYRKSVTELYLDVAKTILDESRDLQLLSAVQNMAEISAKEPSWVPKWHPTPEITMLASDTRWYDASLSGSTKKEISCRTGCADGPTLLHTRGILFDTVDARSVLLGSIGNLEPDHPVEAGLSLVQEGPPTVEIVDALRLVMVAGLQSYSEKAAEQDEKGSRTDFLAYCLADEQLSQKTKDTLMRVYEPYSEDWGEDGDAVEYDRRAEQRCSYRRLFRTSTGRFGLGPAPAQPTDICCVLFGAHVPFVLRRCGSEYKLVGECYIHGVMRGEIVDEMLKGQGEIEDITFS
ncbi:MAG: hypothetical protein Q9218_005610 [Villophora microphyllina]